MDRLARTAFAHVVGEWAPSQAGQGRGRARSAASVHERWPSALRSEDGEVGMAVAACKDAGTLDLIGAMSVAMHVAKLDGKDPGFWQKICDVLLGSGMESCRRSADCWVHLWQLPCWTGR